MYLRTLFVAACLALTLSPAARAGLYYSGEKYNKLPARWRGFLLDHRRLRVIARKPGAGAGFGARPVAASPDRLRYEKEAARLAKLAGERALTADEAADLGALYLRLGEVNKALEILRPAQRDHPDHHALAANLGTGWQMQGNLAQAALALTRAVKLAPPAYRKAEELHLELVRLRARERSGEQGLDDLFGVRYGGAKKKYEPGKIADEERKKLPPDAVALMQRLALWLPADARLLWQLGELAAVGGDLRTAAAMMDGCVVEFSLRHPTLRKHRLAMRAAAGDPKAPPPDKVTHAAGHIPLFKPASDRPLIHELDLATLPAIDPKGTNTLPWEVVTKTVVDRRYRPTFPKYLKDLDGKQVRLRGFIQPLGDEQEFTAFMLVEYPIGCWYCEMPEVTGIVLAEMPEGKTAKYVGGLVEITGKLSLNADDPENFLYTLLGAKVHPPK
jgi:hypothetical protein